jgi:hypothetical protein
MCDLCKFTCYSTYCLGRKFMRYFVLHFWDTLFVTSNCVHFMDSALALLTIR